MTRSLITLSVLALLVGCGSEGETTPPPEPQDVVVDTFNVAFAGAFIPYEAERRQPIVDAIAASDADILCLQEVWTQADKELIRDAAIDAFPHSALFEDNLQTPIDDATDQQGAVPPPPTTVPCGETDIGEGVTIADQMNEAVDCVSANCSTMPGSEDGRTTSIGCAGSACVGAVGGLLFGDVEQQRCYTCLATQLPTATFAEIRTSCTTVVEQDLAFEGQNGVMILSKHPLENAQELVVPGTFNRRTILSATVKLPNGAELDTYCNHLTPIFTDFTFPYTGQYGDGMTGAAGWQAEQELQAQKLINYVNENSDGRPAVILGDFNAGHAYPAEEIVAEGEPTLDLLESVFPPAYTTDYAPLCTFCSTNPVAGTEVSVWIDHILLHNLSADSVVSTDRIYDEDVVPVDGQMVPLSDHFGMRSVITVP